MDFQFTTVDFEFTTVDFNLRLWSHGLRQVTKRYAQHRLATSDSPNITHRMVWRLGGHETVRTVWGLGRPGHARPPPRGVGWCHWFGSSLMSTTNRTRLGSCHGIHTISCCFIIFVLSLYYYNINFNVFKTYFLLLWEI